MYDFYPATSPYTERGDSGLGHPYYPIDAAPRQPHERPARDVAAEYSRQCAMQSEVQMQEVSENGDASQPGTN